MRRTRLAAMFLAGALASSAAACSDGTDEPTGATVPEGGAASSTTSSTTSTSTSVAPASYDVPEVIDQAYVQRVVSAYDQVLGDAIRVLKRDGALTEEFLSHLLAIYTEREFEVHQRAWAQEAAEGRAAKTAEPPAAPVTSVVRLENASAACVIVRADRDYSPTLKPGVPQVRTQNDQYLVLVPKQQGRDPLTMNPTPWVMAFDGSKRDNSVPRDACAE